MKKVACLLLWHCTDMNDIEVRHQFCPKGESSWCKYQRDKISGKERYKGNLNIPNWIHDIIKPVFNELSSDNLLLNVSKSGHKIERSHYTMVFG